MVIYFQSHNFSVVPISLLRSIVNFFSIPEPFCDNLVSLFFQKSSTFFTLIIFSVSCQKKSVYSCFTEFEKPSGCS